MNNDRNNIPSPDINDNELKENERFYKIYSALTYGLLKEKYINPVNVAEQFKNWFFDEEVN